MSLPTTKINGYKQIGDAVYKYNGSSKKYRLIGRNKTYLPLQQYIDNYNERWNLIIQKAKEKLK